MLGFLLLDFDTFIHQFRLQMTINQKLEQGGGRGVSFMLHFKNVYQISFFKDFSIYLNSMKGICYFQKNQVNC
jgi:hypothetical protein